MVGAGFIALSAWLGLAPAAPVRAQPIAVRLRFDAPRGCSSADVFWADVLARGAAARRANATADVAVRVHVRLARAGTGVVRGELKLTERRGETETRVVEGASCDEVVKVLSLTAALALGSAEPRGDRGAPATMAAGGASDGARSPPSPARADAAPARPPRAEPPPSTAAVASPPSSPSSSSPPPPSPSSSSPSSSSLPLSSPPAGASSQAAALPAPRVLSPPAPSPPLPEPSPSPAVVIAAPSPRVARAYVLDLGAEVMGAGVISPGVSLGGALFVRAKTSGPGLRPSLAAMGMLFPSDGAQASGAATARWTAGALTGCPGIGLSAPVVIEPCARVIAGWLSVTDGAVTNPHDVGRAWWSAGGLLRAAARLGGGLAIELDAGFAVPLVERRFVTTTPEHAVGRTPSVSPQLGAGVTYGL